MENITQKAIQNPTISVDIIANRFKQLEDNLKNQICSAKIEIGYALLVSDKDKKKIQKLTEKTRTKAGKEALKKANGDFRKAISLLCASSNKS